MQRPLFHVRKKLSKGRADMASKKMSLEECFEGLDEIISELQSGELSLEDSFKKYEDGMKLIKKCNDTIDKVEKKLVVVENDEE